MATWFGKYNKQGYTFTNTNNGTSSDHIRNKKDSTILKNTSVTAVESGDHTSYNASQKNIKVDEDYVVTSTRSYELLYNLKRGQANYHYNCSDSDVNYFIDNKPVLFNPDKCDPQTFIPDLSYNNIECDNEYSGAKLVDDNGNEINSTLATNTLYAEVKNAEPKDLDVSYNVVNERFDTGVYLFSLPEC